MTEHKDLAMVYALQKFQHYFLGTTFKLFIDHLVLKYLVKNLVLGGEYVDSYLSSKSFNLKWLSNWENIM